MPSEKNHKRSQAPAIESLLLIGFGNMGQALYEGWKGADSVGEITIYDPYVDEDIEESVIRDQDALITETDDLADFADDRFEVIAYAVKPQALSGVFKDTGFLAERVDGALVLSIIAGKSVTAFEQFFHSDKTAVVRAMPNTPGMIAKGVTVAYGNEAVDLKQKAKADTLLQAIGDVYWAESEDQIHAVTALSGSGPGYLFYLVEVLEQAARNLDLPDDIAQGLARQTVIGSGALLEQRNKSDAAELREMVTSPGGTTEAALEILMEKESGLQSLMNKAIQAAEKRSRELADD